MGASATRAENNSAGVYASSYSNPLCRHTRNPGGSHICAENTAGREASRRPSPPKNNAPKNRPHNMLWQAGALQGRGEHTQNQIPNSTACVARGWWGRPRAFSTMRRRGAPPPAQRPRRSHRRQTAGRAQHNTTPQLGAPPRRSAPRYGWRSASAERRGVDQPGRGRGPKTSTPKGTRPPPPPQHLPRATAHAAPGAPHAPCPPACTRRASAPPHCKVERPARGSRCSARSRSPAPGARGCPARRGGEVVGHVRQPRHTHAPPRHAAAHPYLFRRRTGRRSPQRRCGGCWGAVRCSRSRGLLGSLLGLLGLLGASTGPWVSRAGCVFLLWVLRATALRRAPGPLGHGEPSRA
ncbi:hypothetical protein SMICM304S_10181 [Streptomyces microflavus]